MQQTHASTVCETNTGLTTCSVCCVMQCQQTRACSAHSRFASGACTRDRHSKTQRNNNHAKQGGRWGEFFPYHLLQATNKPQHMTAQHIPGKQARHRDTGTGQGGWGPLAQHLQGVTRVNTRVERGCTPHQQPPANNTKRRTRLVGWAEQPCCAAAAQAQLSFLPRTAM